VLTDYAYASPQGIVALAKKCGQVLRADLTKAEREAVVERQRGRVEALNEAGVTQTSTGTGGTAPNADETKVREWKEKVARVRASGRATPEAFAELLAEGKKLGITQ
jgi:sugar phosphate isomerase/epimerase